MMARLIQYMGGTYTVAELADKLGITSSCLRARIWRGAPEERWADPIHTTRAEAWYPTRSGYTEEELYIMYRDRLRHEYDGGVEMLSDFANITGRAAEKLIDKWRRERR